MNTKEKTLVVIKPDGIQRALVGEVVSRFEKIGLKIVGIKMLTPTADLIEKHYTMDPEWLRLTGEKSLKNAKEKGHQLPHTDPVAMGKFVLGHLVRYMTQGPVVAIVLEGPHAVEIVRKLVGSTEPLSSDVGTIRGDFVIDSYALANSDGRSIRNVVHASGSVAESEDEIAHWFSSTEIFQYKSVRERLFDDVNLDGSPE